MESAEELLKQAEQFFKDPEKGGSSSEYSLGSEEAVKEITDISMKLVENYTESPEVESLVSLLQESFTKTMVLRKQIESFPKLSEYRDKTAKNLAEYKKTNSLNSNGEQVRRLEQLGIISGKRTKPNLLLVAFISIFPFLLWYSSLRSYELQQFDFVMSRSFFLYIASFIATYLFILFMMKIPSAWNSHEDDNIFRVHNPQWFDLSIDKKKHVLVINGQEYDISDDKITSVYFPTNEWITTGGRMLVSSVRDSIGQIDTYENTPSKSFRNGNRSGPGQLIIKAYSLGGEQIIFRGASDENSRQWKARIGELILLANKV